MVVYYVRIKDKMKANNNHVISFAKSIESLALI